MSTIAIVDAYGNTVAVQAPLPPGRTDADDSTPVVLSTEDAAILQAIAGSPTMVTGTMVTPMAPVTVLAADPTRSIAIIQNVDATVPIAVRFGAPAALNAGGSFMLKVGETLRMTGPLAALAISAVNASAGNTPITIAHNGATP